jgi:hypothetical protein
LQDLISDAVGSLLSFVKDESFFVICMCVPSARVTLKVCIMQGSGTPVIALPQPKERVGLSRSTEFYDNGDILFLMCVLPVRQQPLIHGTTDGG